MYELASVRFPLNEHACIAVETQGPLNESARDLLSDIAIVCIYAWDVKNIPKRQLCFAVLLVVTLPTDTGERYNRSHEVPHTERMRRFNFNYVDIDLNILINTCRSAVLNTIIVFGRVQAATMRFGITDMLTPYNNAGLISIKFPKK